LTQTQSVPVEYQSPEARPTNVRYTVMIFLGGLAFLTYFDRVCIAWAGDAISRDLHISDQKMGIIFGTFWFAYALFEIPGGWLADWFGARKALARVVLAWSLFTALSGSATGFTSLFIYRFLFGMGEAGAYPSMARVQSQWLPVQSRAWFGGVLWMLSRWGGALSPLIFGAMMEGFESNAFKHFAGAVGLSSLTRIPSWRLGFWMAGVFGVIWVAFFYPWFRDDPAEKEGVNQAELDLIKAGRSPRDVGHVHDPKILWTLFTSPAMWVVCTIGLTVSYGFSFYVSWLPKYLKTVQGIDVKASKWMATLPMLCMGIACLTTGRLSDSFVCRTGKRWLGRAMFPMSGLILSAICLVLLQYAHTRWQAMTLLCIAAFTVDMNQACHWANIVDIGGRYAAMAFGFMNMVGNIGNAAGPPLNERLFNVFGWNALFYVNAIVLVLAAFVWLFNDPDRRFYDNRRETQGPL